MWCSTSSATTFLPDFPRPAGPSPLWPVRAYDSDADRSGSLPARSDRVLNQPMTQGGALAPAHRRYRGALQHHRGAPGRNRTHAGNARRRPLLLVSTINWSRPGDVVANGISVKVARDRSIRVFNGPGCLCTS